MPEWVKASAALTPALEEDRVLTDAQVQAWREQGFTLVDGVIPGDLLTRATADATRLFPPAGSPETEAVTDFGSMGRMEFPTESDAANTITLHPRLLRALAQLLGIKETRLRLTQADLWPKYGRATSSGADRDNTDQRMHVDYPNHTLTHPPPWASPEAVEIILYLSDVDDCGGATALVPRSGDDDPAYAYPIVNTPGVGGLEWINDRSHAEAYLSEVAPEIAEWRAKHLYPREVRARFQVGTILFYRHDTWHRGTPLARGGMRLVHNMTFRRAGAEWISTLHSGWAWAMYRRSKVMERLIASATVEQRCVLGFPEPGHSFWTRETVSAVSARYGALGIDMTPYERALPAGERHAVKPDPIRIREYAPDDLEACRDLWRALNARHREIYEDPTLGGDDPGLEFDAYLRHPRLFGVWVAESNGHPVGLCGLLRDGDETELEPIVVRPDARRRGIGAALVAHALETSRTAGATYFNVRPVSRNVEAIAFFRRQGFNLLTRTELSMQLDRGSTFDHELEFQNLRFRY